MARRPALALARPGPVRVGFAVPWRRALELAAASLALLALLYLGARLTPLFTVDEIRVTGASPRVAGQARSAAQPFLGRSLVGLDGDDLLSRVEALPSIRSAEYDRAFPATLRLVVVPERPLAVLRSGDTWWLVSARGRVIRKVDRAARATRPVVQLERFGAVQPGVLVADPDALLGLAALAALPERFPARIRRVEAKPVAVLLLLGSGAELRLGDEIDLRLKLAVAARVLRSMPHDERAALGYLDVSVPDRPVASDKPQVST